jgi:hypothetical protein
MSATHRRLAATALAASLAALPAAAGQLDGAAIEAALAGATTSGVNVYGNPYTVHFRADGSLDGVAGADNDYADTGTWWIDGDTLCRRWTTWLDGKAACFFVVLDGGTITWIDSTTGDKTPERYQAPQ